METWNCEAAKGKVLHTIKWYYWLHDTMLQRWWGIKTIQRILLSGSRRVTEGCRWHLPYFRPLLFSGYLTTIHLSVGGQRWISTTGHWHWRWKASREKNMRDNFVFRSMVNGQKTLQSVNTFFAHKRFRLSPYSVWYPPLFYRIY